jgi:hypothetical protein
VTTATDSTSQQLAALERIKSKLNRIVVQDVELVVKELRRITLLWDELWLGSLNQHHSDIQKRLMGLAEEAKRLTLNTTLSIEQKSKMMMEQQKEWLLMKIFKYCVLLSHFSELKIGSFFKISSFLKLGHFMIFKKVLFFRNFNLGYFSKLKVGPFYKI